MTTTYQPGTAVQNRIPAASLVAVVRDAPLCSLDDEDPEVTVARAVAGYLAEQLDERASQAGSAFEGAVFYEAADRLRALGGVR